MTSQQRIPIIVSGAYGRMGSAIIRLASERQDFEIVGLLERPERIKERPPMTIRGKEIPLVSDLKELHSPAGTVLIEFTTPAATRTHASLASQHNLKLVSGTTGLSDTDLAALHDAARTTAVLWASNMSLGVTVLTSLVEQLARRLQHFDIEIVEMHHRLKRDAPSGTALTLAQAAARGRALSFEEAARFGRKGMVGPRHAEEIGIHAVRGGDVVGDHTVIFAGEGERVEITHRAHSRDTFAAGALEAARFLADKSRGFYSMRDVLGL